MKKRRTKSRIPIEASPVKKAEIKAVKLVADGWIMLGLVLLAWFHRLAFLGSNRDRSWPFTIFYQGDTRPFYEYALALLKGVPYDGDIPFHPPGFPYFLAGLYSLLGVDPVSGQVPHLLLKSLLALVGSLPIGFIYLLAKDYLGRGPALLAALLCLYHFGFYVIAVAPVTEGLYLALLLGTLTWWARTLPHPLSPVACAPLSLHRGWLRGLLLGFLMACLVLTRAEALLTVAILVVVGFFGCLQAGPGPALWKRRRHAASPWLVAVFGLILLVSPWTYRNVFKLRQANIRLSGSPSGPLPTFVPVTLYGPINLAMANHEGADGRFSRKIISSQSHRGVLDLKNPQHLTFLLEGEKMAWDYISGHPVSFVELVLRKWSIFLQVGKLGWTQWNWPGGLEGERRPVDMFAPKTSLLMWILFPLILLGWILCFRDGGARRRWAVLALLLSAAGFGVTALFFGYVRQGLLLLPFWLSFVAVALIWIGTRVDRSLSRRLWFSQLRSRLYRHGFKLALLAMLMLALLEGLGMNGDRNYRASGTTLAGESRLNPDESVFIKVIPPKKE